MRFSRLLPFAFLLLAVPTLAQQKPNPTLVKNYGSLPLSFEKNRGQTDKRVKFLSRGNGYSLFLTPKEAVFSLKQKRQEQGAVLRMQLLGSNAHAPETTQAKLSGTTNYFRGNNSSKWRTGVENYGRVGFAEVYKGVDVVYYGNQSQLEYDFIVKPHAQPSEIRLKFAGATKMKTLPSGELLLETGNGSLKWHSPIAYQEANGKRRQVSAKYQLTKGREVCFAVGDYDKSKPLVIDPVLVYSTYVGGGSNIDFGEAIAVDGTRYAYVIGRTFSNAYPTTAGTFQTKYMGDMESYLTKLNLDGTSVVFSTYLGGSLLDWAYGVAVDAVGHIYVVGKTWSTDFPVTKGALQTKINGVRNGFIMKFGVDGRSLVYSTYLGGDDDNGYVNAVALDSANNVYVVGYTVSKSFPTTANAFQKKLHGPADAYVTKLSADGKSILYSSYIGGRGKFDYARSVALDSSGNVYVLGETDSDDFPTTPGAFQTKFHGVWDGFVIKFSADFNTVYYSTCLGGTKKEWARSIAADNDGNAYITGGTASPEFPTTQGAFQTKFGGKRDAYLTKLSADGKSLVFSTFLGGDDDDIAYTLALDRWGNPYIVGYTESVGFPTTEGAYQTTYKGQYDGFIAKFMPNGSSLFYSTYFGGSDYEWIRAIAIDYASDVYITGYTTSKNFPVTQGAFDTYYKGEQESFIAKLSLPHTILLLPVHALFGGEATMGTVLLDHVALKDTRVFLASDNSLVTLPSSVVIHKGTDSVNINVLTAPTNQDTEVHLTTTPQQQLNYSILKVLAPRTLTNLATPSGLVFGTQGTGTVTLDGATPDTGVGIHLESDDPAISVPSSITIPAFQNSVEFALTAGNVTTDTPVTLSAKYGNTILKKRIIVQKIGVIQVTLNSNNIKGGTTVRGNVTVKGTIPAGGLMVNLSSNKSDAQVPKTLTVPAGKTSVGFTITTNKVTKKVNTNIMAQYGSTTAQTTLTINP